MHKRHLTPFLLLGLTLFSGAIYADRVSVNGKTYECSNSCSINTGPPMTIQDCCGGTVALLQREAIEIS